MTRLIAPLFLLIAAVSAVAAAAQPRDIPHFPLQLGNSWELTFSYEIGPGFYPPTDTLVVKDVLGVDDPSTYFIVDPILGIPDTLKTDGTQRVFAIRFGSDYLLFDFRAPDSSMYRIPSFISIDDSGMVFVQHGYVVETPAGTFEDCIRFAVDYVPSVTDDEASFYFAPEVGLVKYASGWALGHLSRATIHGKTITRAERPTRPELTSLSVFPNPVSTSASVEITTGLSGRVRLSIFDALGRERRTLLDGFASSGARDVRVHADGLPSGFYLLVLDEETSRTVTSLVVVR